MTKILSVSMAALALTLAACNPPAEAPAQVPATETPVATTEAPVVQTAGGMTVEDAWCRPTPNGAKAGGCYVILTSAADDVLKSVSSDLADMAQVHEMKHEDGMMKMSHLANGLALPAGVRTELKPHGNHIMLMGLKAPLVDGQTAKITLTFDKAEAQTIDFAIRRPPVVGGEE
ncbi:copper chaperone PCu(A)C [Brevundimonas sp.]|uniref:copper chaperone PCu(A)C n=1 Tax=Brevundimonas sp. TaxID=1871086 RepID=UPI0028A0C48F|nr:copper chaperone PCu(A)C [Brevundimonas sp.]